MRFSKKYRALRITGLTLLILFGAVLLFGVLFSSHYKRLIQARLPELSAKATDSLYHITIEDISINIFTRAITVSGIRMVPDTVEINKLTAAGRPPGRIYDISIPEAEIRGLKWNGLETERELGCRKIRLFEPKVVIYLNTDSVTDTVQLQRPPQISHLFAKQIRITNPDFQVYRGRISPEPVYRSKGGLILAQDWDFIPGRAVDTSHFFFTREADVSLEQVYFNLPGTSYGIGMDSVRFSNISRTLGIQGLHIKPSVSREEFYNRAGMQSEIYDVAFRHAVVRGLAWGALWEQHSFIASGLDMDGADIDVFFSRIPPPNTINKVGNYPHQLLRKLPIVLVLPVVNIHNCGLHYTEFNNKTMRPATISFSQVHGTVTNITNVPDDILGNPHCIINMNGKFMDRGDIFAQFDFFLSSPKGGFDINARLTNLDGSQLSEPARALTLAEIKSLQLHEMAFRISGDEDSSNGVFRILYDDLKIKLLRLDTATMHMRNRPIISFMANNLLLYNDNPMEGDTVRLAYTHVARDPLKPFFNLIWKNIFASFVQTTVRTGGITDMVKRQRANKGKPKRHFFKGLFPKRHK